MQEKILEILIQGGLTSTAIVALVILYRIVNNHLFHLNETLIKLETTITKLITYLEDRIE